MMMMAASLLAQNMSSAEKAIKEVIENETKFYNERNYDAWASTWAHDEGVYWSVTGPELSMSTHGWEALAKEAKAYFKQNPQANPYTPKKDDYHFVVNGNMAFVTFKENGNMSSRVLVKDKGNWKLLRMDVVQTKAYEHQSNKRMLQSMAGVWKLDPATVNLNDDTWTLHALKCKVKTTEMGMKMYVESDWESSGGVRGIWKDDYAIAYDRSSAGYPVMLSEISPEGSSVWTGNCHFKDEYLVIKAKPVASEGLMKHKIMPESANKLKMHYLFTNDAGETMWEMSFTLVKEQEDALTMR